VKLAKERLGQLGVKVVDASLGQEDLLPFEDGEFDLVLNRHSGLNCSEIARILSPGGVFLTQQIHSLWAQDLLAEFGAIPQWPDTTPEHYASRLKMAGLDVEQVEDWHGRLVFQDVGAIVYYLKAVPWLVPGFSVATHTVNLMRLQDKLQHEGQLTFEARQYLIKACKAN